MIATVLWRTARTLAEGDLTLAQPPSEQVRAELRDAIRRDTKVMGRVFPLLEQNFPDRQIAETLGYENAGFVSNNRAHIRAILNGTIPGGVEMSRQAAGSARRIRATPGLSADTLQHLDELREARGANSGSTPPRKVATPSRPGANLRSAVDQEVRSGVKQLIAKIREEAGIDADDYNRAYVAEFALDEVVRLVQVQPMSRTSAALYKVGQYDLSIEQAVVDWAQTLPVTSELVAAARGRLDYWMVPDQPWTVPEASRLRRRHGRSLTPRYEATLPSRRVQQSGHQTTWRSWSRFSSINPTCRGATLTRSSVSSWPTQATLRASSSPNSSTSI